MDEIMRNRPAMAPPVLVASARDRPAYGSAPTEEVPEVPQQDGTEDEEEEDEPPARRRRHDEGAPTIEQQLLNEMHAQTEILQKFYDLFVQIYDQ